MSKENIAEQIIADNKYGLIFMGPAGEIDELGESLDTNMVVSLKGGQNQTYTLGGNKGEIIPGQSHEIVGTELDKGRNDSESEAIAKSIECCMKLKVPTLAIIIGEGGSGGAIALASASKVLMLENAIYSVISPEGCATILWRDPKKMLDAAKAMKLSARDLLELQIIDEIVAEPSGGAHRDKNLILQNVRNSISKNLDYFKTIKPEQIFNERKNKFLRIGRTKGFIDNLEDLSSLNSKINNFELIMKSKKTTISILIIVLTILISLLVFL